MIINQKDLCKLCGELVILSLGTYGCLRGSIKKLSTINDLYNAKISPLLYPIYRVNERKV